LSIIRPVLKYNSKLEKHTIIKKHLGDELKEFTISFDDLNSSLGELLGSGAFGTVKKWFHAASSTTFAVKVIFNRTQKR
jgi:hypothetical protein